MNTHIDKIKQLYAQLNRANRDKVIRKIMKESNYLMDTNYTGHSIYKSAKSVLYSKGSLNDLRNAIRNSEYEQRQFEQTKSDQKGNSKTGKKQDKHTVPKNPDNSHYEITTFGSNLIGNSKRKKS